MDKQLGKITSVRFGHGGYQDAQFGIWFQFGNDGWGCGSGKGVWQGGPSTGAKWTMADKEKTCAEIMLYIEDLMRQAKVADVKDLKGVPVELTFDKPFGTLESWRILTEVI